jgi:hypothetical protein
VERTTYTRGSLVVYLPWKRESRLATIVATTGPLPASCSLPPSLHESICGCRALMGASQPPGLAQTQLPPRSPSTRSLPPRQHSTARCCRSFTQRTAQAPVPEAAPERCRRSLRAFPLGVDHILTQALGFERAPQESAPDTSSQKPYSLRSATRLPDPRSSTTMFAAA